MSDDYFTKHYRYISKNVENEFTIKYVVEPKQNERDGNRASPLKHANVERPPSENIMRPTNPQKNKSPEKQKNQKQPQPPIQSGKKKNYRKVLQMKSEQEFTIYKNFNKINKKKTQVRVAQEDPFSFKKKPKKPRHGKVQKNIESESEEQLEHMYELLSQQFNKREKKSRSIDNFAAKSRKEKQEHFYQDKQKKKAIYAAHLNIDDIIESRANEEKKYFKGTVDFSERVKFFAKIFSKEIEGDLVAEGDYKNRCIHGDEVYFEVLPENENKKDDQHGDRVRCRVVAILPWRKEGRRKIVGKVEFNRKKNTYYLIPINKRITSFDIKLSDIGYDNLKKVNDKYLLAEFTEWKQTEDFPSCKVISEFGALGQIDTETSALLVNNGVDDQQYDEQTIHEGLKKFIERIDETGEYKIAEQQIKKRSDLREERIFTIDPLTARDFDDALSITECGTNDKGHKVYEVGVHIADASFFVEEDGLIDDFAQKKTTSVYLVHRVLPMLPRILCETMCSLNPGLERLTLSIWFKVTEQGEVLPGSRYDRSVIHSKARFTYEQAQQIIDGEVKSQKEIEKGFGCIHEKYFPSIAQDIITMNKIAMKIRTDRIEGGSLVFETMKKSFKLDENYYPQSYVINKRFQANFLVEQYMLLANQKVGEILVQKMRSSALLRKHQFPSDKKIERFQKFTTKINHPIKITRDIKIQQKLNEVLQNPKIKQCVKDILNYEMIFILEQAQYFVVADVPEKEWIHYALNMPIYTHFTSPIRRYPDIIVHRQLTAIIDARNQGKSDDQIVVPHYNNLKDLVQRCNKNKMNAKKVSSGCEKIFLCLYLKTHPVSCKAILTAVNEYCLNICVPTYDFRSAIELKQLKKVKVLNFSQDNSERKYVQLEYEYEAGEKTKLILKEMQEVDIRLTAKQGFPIDYMIRLMFPHPKNIGQMITFE